MYYLFFIYKLHFFWSNIKSYICILRFSTIIQFNKGNYILPYSVNPC